MPDLIIDLKIPIRVEHSIGAPALTFSHWLPLGKEQGITIDERGLEILIWFDLQSTWWASQPTEDDLKNNVNVLAHYALCQVTVRGIEPNLSNYVAKRGYDKPNDSVNDAHENQYTELGNRVIKTVFSRFNRLIAYARVEKGQFWLVEYDLEEGRDNNFFRSLEAKAKIDDGDTFGFNPVCMKPIVIHMVEEKRYISETEWSKVIEFVVGNERPSLTLELLSRANQLAKHGFARSALIEAVTALEISVSDFAISNGKLANKFGERLAVNSLKKQVEHLGLSGTVRFLIPLLLDNDALPSNVLSACQEAITIRNNVVHNGQRNIDDIIRLISNIETFCGILISYCDD